MSKKKRLDDLNIQRMQALAQTYKNENRDNDRHFNLETQSVKRPVE